MRHICTILCFALITTGFAQDTGSTDWRVYRKGSAAPTSVGLKDSTKKAPSEPGKIAVKQDARINDLAKRYDKMKHVQKGFRVQIFLGSKEGQAKARSEFMTLYPKYATYLDWQAPNFKVRVGDFKKRMDAEKLLLEIRKDFPGAYIVPDEVELDKLP